MAEHITHMPDTFTAFFATPGDECKEFSRPGGFKGQSVSPYYLVKRLTERFGLCGKGWMVKHYATEYVKADNGTVLVYVLLSLLYKESGDTEWAEVGPHYGGDVAVEHIKKAERQTENKDKTFNHLEVDDEAAKKAYTDAFAKCCSWLGLAGSIHDGFSDGDKYTATKPWDVSPEESIKKVRTERASKPELTGDEKAAAKAAVQQETGESAVITWSAEEAEEYVVLVQTEMYSAFSEAGRKDLYQAEADKWKARRATDAPAVLLPALRDYVKKAQDGAEKAKAKATKDAKPEASEKPEKAPDPEFAYVVTEEEAKEAINKACGRFVKCYEIQNVADVKGAVLKIRADAMKTLKFKGDESQAEKIMMLAKAVDAIADKLKI
jgi:hypothetical protein